MIVAGYPCIGKTTYAESRDDVLDHMLIRRFVGDDPHFDPDYAKENADIIIEKQKEYRHVLIPIDDQVLAELSKRGVPYTVVVQDPRDKIGKEEYQIRFANKSQEFIDEHIGKWEEYLTRIIKTYHRVVLMKYGLPLATYMHRVDTKLDRISVKAAFPGKLISVKRADGTSYIGEDRHLAHIGQRGVVAFLDGAYPGYPSIAFFYMETEYLRTSPGEFYRSVDQGREMVTIRTRNSVYSWRVTGPGISPDRYHEIAEKFILRHH